MSEEKLKLLVCGDVGGKFKTLFARVMAVMEKSGTFDLLLCVGDFFGESEQTWLPYKSGALKVPLPIYILGPNKASHVPLYPTSEGGELCPNVNVLGKRGMLSTSGLKIAYVSGCEADSVSQFGFTEKDIVSVRDIAFRNANFMGIDVLLTSEWPENVTHNHPTTLQAPKGSRNISWLACQLKPRYHFCGLHNLYYERPPYQNHSDGRAHCTRFISLGKVGNQQKQKWLYAVSLTPINKMKGIDLYQTTTDQTDCPYPADMMRMSIAADAGSGKQFFYDMNAKSEEESGKRKRKEGHGGGKRMDFDQDQCWFCLANPTVEKHLVISIGEHMYLALVKGSLTDDHVMILPVEHQQTSIYLSEAGKSELKKFKSSLKKCFKKQNKVPVYFERNYKTSHLQIQVIPVPVGKTDVLKELFQSMAEEQGLELDELPVHAKLEDLAPVGTPYFYTELPGGERLFCRCRKNFPLHFGRDVLASESVLDLPDQLNWRDCVKGESEEIQLVEKFRAMFSKYDFTTDDD